MLRVRVEKREKKEETSPEGAEAPTGVKYIFLHHRTEYTNTTTVLINESYYTSM
jgi:hypothetical protein